MEGSAAIFCSLLQVERGSEQQQNDIFFLKTIMNMFFGVLSA
jgi:hypothetical protein